MIIDALFRDEAWLVWIFYSKRCSMYNKVVNGEKVTGRALSPTREQAERNRMEQIPSSPGLKETPDRMVVT
jgi:hypothetical protein